MSYELKIDPKSRAAGRFIGQVRKALVSAAIDEKKSSGITQTEVASRLGVNRSVINRLLKGESNLTLRSIAEICWALGWEPVFSLRRRPKPAQGQNHPETAPVFKPSITRTTTTTTAVPTPVATTRSNVVELAG